MPHVGLSPLHWTRGFLTSNLGSYQCSFTLGVQCIIFWQNRPPLRINVTNHGDSRIYSGLLQFLPRALPSMLPLPNITYVSFLYLLFSETNENNFTCQKRTTPPRDDPKSRGPKDKVRIRIVLFPFTPFTRWWRWGRLRHEDFDVYTILLFSSFLTFRAMSGSGTNWSEWVYFSHV